MPASRRTILLIATAAVLLAAFAVLPAPRLIVRRSPVVSDRVAGDVRRVAMAVEPDGSMHAALEVWTDSDWDIEYWSSITNLTPVARVVTQDLIEQREVAIATAGSRLALAWVDYDAKAKTSTLQVTGKMRIDRNWAKPIAIATRPSPIRDVAVAIDARGEIAVAFVDEAGLRIGYRTPDGMGGSAAAGPRGARHPSIAFVPGDDPIAVAYEAGGRIWLSRTSLFTPGGTSSEPSTPEQVAAGIAPHVQAAGGTVRLAWAERDAIAVRVGAGAVRRVAAAGLGDTRPAIAFRDDVPVAVWPEKSTIRALDADGRVVTLPAGGCCPSVAGTAAGTWTAWLESKPGNAIERVTRVAYAGRAGRFTAGDRIPVTALPASP